MKREERNKGRTGIREMEGRRKKIKSKSDNGRKEGRKE